MAFVIDFCHRDEGPVLMQFIDEHWGAGHVLARHRDLLDSQHYDVARERYNFVVARSDASDDFLGVLGFIPTDRYDATLTDSNVIWLALWKVRDNAGISGLGLALHAFLLRNVRHIAVGTVGINAEVERLYRALRYETGVMAHYYRSNPMVDDFRIAVNPRLGADDTGATHKRIAPIDATSLFDTPMKKRDLVVPNKTVRYLVAKYANHPFYHYEFYTIFDTGSIDAVFVVRKIEQHQRRVIRIIDFVGEAAAWRGCGASLGEIVVSNNAEYIDFLTAGFDESALRSAGFVPVSPNDQTIIPNYFEPFEQRNVELRYAVKLNTPGVFRLVKGDADQERPNALS